MHSPGFLPNAGALCMYSPINARNEKNSAFFCWENPEMPVFTTFFDFQNRSRREPKEKKQLTLTNISVYNVNRELAQSNKRLFALDKK